MEVAAGGYTIGGGQREEKEKMAGKGERNHSRLFTTNRRLIFKLLLFIKPNTLYHRKHLQNRNPLDSDCGN